jgi:hypothetical protein
MSLNARCSVRCNLELDSNEIDENDLQNEKYDEQRISIFRGITINFREEYENTNDLILFNPDFDSKEIDQSDLHDEKHIEWRISIIRGISISDEDEKRRINLRCTISIRHS